MMTQYPPLGLRGLCNDSLMVFGAHQSASKKRFNLSMKALGKCTLKLSNVHNMFLNSNKIKENLDATHEMHMTSNLKQSHYKIRDQRVVIGHQKQSCIPAPGWKE